jgi:hypothetical protein
MGDFIRAGGPRKGFSNRSITPPVYSKPHICYRQGYWRVSSQLKPYHLTHATWRKAYDFAGDLNGEVRLQRIIAAATKQRNERG